MYELLFGRGVTSESGKCRSCMQKYGQRRHGVCDMNGVEKTMWVKHVRCEERMRKTGKEASLFSCMRGKQVCLGDSLSSGVLLYMFIVYYFSKIWRSIISTKRLSRGRGKEDENYEAHKLRCSPDVDLLSCLGFSWTRLLQLSSVVADMCEIWPKDWGAAKGLSL